MFPETESGEVGNGNHNAPDESFVILYLGLPTNWCRDVKHSKCAGDVKEQSSKSELFARTNSAMSQEMAQKTVPSAYLLPVPNNHSSGSMTKVSSLPSFKNRSGS